MLKMLKSLQHHCTYFTAYLSNLIIYSYDWQRHMQHVRAGLKTLSWAGLSVNLAKCPRWHGWRYTIYVWWLWPAYNPRPKRRWENSCEWRDIIMGLCLIILSSPVSSLFSLKRESRIWSNSWISASGHFYVLRCFHTWPKCLSLHPGLIPVLFGGVA